MQTINWDHAVLDLAVNAADRPDPRSDLDLWDDAIIDLDIALQDAAHARAIIDRESTALDRIEASHVLGIEGGNAETRRARLTLVLADDARYQVHQERLREARMQLMDAERRVTVAKERCRLLRTSIALTANDEDR